MKFILRCVAFIDFWGILSVVWVRHGPLAALIDAHRWRSHTKFWFQIIDGDACAMCVRVYVVRVWLMADGDAIMIYQVSRLVRQRQRLAAMWLRNSLDARNEMKKHRLFSCSTNETFYFWAAFAIQSYIYIYWRRRRFFPTITQIKITFIIESQSLFFFSILLRLFLSSWRDKRIKSIFSIQSKGKLLSIFIGYTSTWKATAVAVSRAGGSRTFCTTRNDECVIVCWKHAYGTTPI